MQNANGRDLRKGRRLGRGSVALVLAALMGAPAVASPAAASPRSHYDFDTGVQGWRGANATLTHDVSRAAHGAGSLRVSATARRGSSTWRAYVSGMATQTTTSTTTPSPTTTVSAWALLPPGTAGRNWKVQIEVTGPDRRLHRGPTRSLIAGEWINVKHEFPRDVTDGARRLALRFRVTGAEGPVSINVDTLRQGPAALATQPAPGAVDIPARTMKRKSPIAVAPPAPAPAPALAPAPAPAPSALTNYDFEPGVQGWSGENSSVAHDLSRGAHGQASLRLTRTVGSGWSSLRAFDDKAEIRDLTSTGGAITAWALVPTGTPGRDWRARLEVQDANWNVHAGQAAPLVPGQWVQVQYLPPAEVARNARRYSVQFEVTDGNGQVSVNLDTHQQQPNSPVAPPAEQPPVADPTPAPPIATPVTVSRLRVQANRIVDSDGRPVRLVGVNHAGPEYACSQGWGFFDGPNSESVQAGFVRPIADWKATAVRVPLNEHCWLDVNSAIPADRRGAAYQKAITDYVQQLNAAGLTAILELHWHAPGARKTDNNPMPNRDNSPRFWSSVASHFKNNPNVVFELVNEPHPDSNGNTVEAWRCWRDGGSCAGVVDRATRQPYQAAGMQELVDAIRQTGSDQLILAGGIQYANRLNRWLEYRPTDPKNNLAAAWHVYDFNGCRTVSCYDSEVAPVALQVPLVTTEVGPDQACEHCGPSHTGFSETLLNWLDTRQAGYLAWTWNRWSGDHHMLTTDWAGTPTPWGAQFRERLVNAAR